MGDVWLSGPSMAVQVPVQPLVDSLARARQALDHLRCAGTLCGRYSHPVPGCGCPSWRLVGWVARSVGVIRLAGPAPLPRWAGAGPAVQSPPGPRLGVGE